MVLAGCRTKDATRDAGIRVSYGFRADIGHRNDNRSFEVEANARKGVVLVSFPNKHEPRRDATRRRQLVRSLEVSGSKFTSTISASRPPNKHAYAWLLSVLVKFHNCTTYACPYRCIPLIHIYRCSHAACSLFSDLMPFVLLPADDSLIQRSSTFLYR